MKQRTGAWGKGAEGFRRFSSASHVSTYIALADFCFRWSK